MNRRVSVLAANASCCCSALPLACTVCRQHLSACVTLQVKLLSQQEVIFALDKEVPIIDIRPPEEYRIGHIVG